MSSLKAKAVKYAVLPGIFPRVMALVTSGFSYTAFLIAFIYETLGLLPRDHPYLNPANRGKFGIRHVIGEAANNLVFSRKNIDQIIIFFITIVGFVLLFAQFGLMIVALVMQQPAMAMPTMSDLFSVTSQYGHGSAGGAQDIAFIIMDRVFGLKRIYESCVALQGVDCLSTRGTVVPSPGSYPLPFHKALHSLLQFYSLGIFFVGVIIILYFVTTIVSETAASGTPFGERANRTWAPIRLIFFFAMLVPLNVGDANSNPGLNGAQLVTFWTAKFGSNFATNAWGYFNNTLGSNELINPDHLVSTPKPPEIRELAQFMFVAKTCKIVEEKASKSDIDIRGYIVRPPSTGGSGPNHMAFNATGALDFDTVKDFTNSGNIIISFGHLDTSNPEYNNYTGNVKPICGQLTINITETWGSTEIVQRLNFILVQSLWADLLVNTVPYANCVVERTYPNASNPNCNRLPDNTFIESYMGSYQPWMNLLYTGPIQNIAASADWSLSAEIKAKGWAGAALWYNQIAQRNGAIVSAVLNFPRPTKYPMVMETVAANRRAMNENIGTSASFDPVVSENQKIVYDRPDIDPMIAPVLYAAFMAWDENRPYETPFNRQTGNFVVDTINLLMGTSGIFDMVQNADIHPLAQLSALGKSMMDASIRNMAYGMGGDGLGKLFEKQTPGEVGKLLSGFFWSFGIASLAMSFVLYYVLPFLPFIYFMFAVSGWVKSIFEAIVAMPLWALAHLRIDGEGLPGRDASNGYFLVFEIFLRPILIVFGLLASIIIFGALVKVLNNIFKEVVLNVAGFNIETGINPTGPDSTLEYMRQPVDQFFYTAIYVIIVYMMALSCFKLIDIIPNNILRWMGVSVSTMRENAGDPAGELSGHTYTGTQLLTGQLQGGLLAAIK